MIRGLEILKTIKRYQVVLDSEKDIVKNIVEIFPISLNIVEKELNALKIVKEKYVDFFQLPCCKNIFEYNDLKFFENEKLTQDEFDLLKEVLCDD